MNELTEAPTRREMLLGMLQKEYPSYHPLISIARIAHNEEADLKTQLECHKTIAKYVEPELKSIEVKGEVNARHRVTVSLFDPVQGEYAEVIGPESLGVQDKMLRGVEDMVQSSVIEGVDYQTVDRKVVNW
jgi:hypothetical protein